MGPFTDWQPKKMRKLTKFCEENDPNKPDFIKDCAKEGLVRVSCVGNDDPVPPNEEE